MQATELLPAEPFTALLHAEELEERLEFLRIAWECDGGGTSGHHWVSCRVHIIFSLPEDGYDAESITDTGVVDTGDTMVLSDGGMVYDPAPEVQQLAP